MKVYSILREYYFKMLLSQFNVYKLVSNIIINLQCIRNETSELCVSPLSLAAAQAYIPEWYLPTRCSTNDLVDIITPHETFCVTDMP